MLAFSYGFHHSVNLEAMEQKIAEVVEESKQLITIFKETGIYQGYRRRKEVRQKLSELYTLRRQLAIPKSELWETPG